MRFLVGKGDESTGPMRHEMFGRSAVPTSSIRPSENIPRGICYVCASAALGAVMSVAIKWLATILGYIVWGNVPTASLMVGVALITSSGLYILHREARANRTASRPS
jgi:hypothetical protein